MLTFKDKFDERDIELGLVKEVEKFLLEMGTGFAFMGRQYHLEVSGEDYYIDLLMYNTFMHRYMVIELKNTEFIPEYIGKLNFYCSAVDDILCREGDNKTIGLLLCRTKRQNQGRICFARHKQTNWRVRLRTRQYAPKRFSLLTAFYRRHRA